MRIAAGLIIMVLCSAWGFRSSIMLKRRCALIRELRLMVERYSIEIACTAPTLDELAGCGGGEFGSILQKNAAQCGDIRSAWRTSVGELSAQPHCGKEEAAVLSEMGQALGTCPADSQQSLLKLYSARLDRLLKQAEAAAEQKGRLYRSGGVLAGMGVAVLLL